eukprot:TRINITY_DN1852_c0_g1_i1.p1 TRINITY_DN1852_c0_g1~~TRINITY_DN1852_c0_g1_i1.p1  ORF type:complete len:295 (+),score=54.38 TRINITY_DN1852_c0_g1_i1:27-887(+)
MARSPVATWRLGVLTAVLLAFVAFLCVPPSRSAVALVAREVARSPSLRAVPLSPIVPSEAVSVPSGESWRERRPSRESTAAVAVRFGLPAIVTAALLGPMLYAILARLRPARPLTAPFPIAMASLSGERADRPVGGPAAWSVRRGIRPLYSRMRENDVADVERHLMNYLTYKSVRVVLNQLVETDLSPMKADFMWLRQFCIENPPSDSENFLKKLSTARPQFADRLMVTRLDMFTQWSKWMDAGDGIRQRITDSNLRVHRHQLNRAVTLEFKGKGVRVSEPAEKER